MHLKTLAYVFLFAIYSTCGDNKRLSPRAYINYVQYLSSANVQDEQSYYLVLFGR